MKLSRFNLWVNDYPQKGENLLFNTRTQAIIKVNEELKQSLESLSKKQNSVRSSLVNDNIQALKENGIIVEDEKEEAKKLDEFFHHLRNDTCGLSFEATILTTYNCNFSCVYCFEESVRDEVFMDQQTSHKVIDWLIKKIKKENYKKIFLVFYGGEPLLNVEPIYCISYAMHKWAKENGADFKFGMITNGSLLAPELVDGLIPLGLSDIRITVDGDREAHDQKRPFTNGRPTFDCIMENIKKIINKKISIGISGNFDRENYDSIPRLLDYLEQEDILDKLQKIEFAPLNPRLGPKETPGAVELEHCFSFSSVSGLHQEVVNIKKELMRRKLNTDTGLAVNACALVMKHAGVTIDPEGVLYKCNALVGYPEFSIGNVNDEFFNKQDEKFFNIKAWEKCPKDCPYVPMCQGGCRFFSYMENNDYSRISCKREYLDLITPELIKLEYEKLIA
ncbi:MAG: radical SAM protein [Candidatus Omnitrophota bacterium]